MKQLHFFLFVAICSILSFSACEKNDNNPNNTYRNGYFVLCEGSFGNNNCEISFIDNTGAVTEKAFKAENSRALGDVAQSLTVIDDLVWLVINNSQKVEVLDATSFKSKKTITDERLTYPRYVTKLDENRVLISNGSGTEDAAVFVINSTTFEIENTIPIPASGPNHIVQHNNKIFTANSGGSSVDSTVTVIDAKSLTVEKTIVVGDMPMGLEIDNNGNLLVLCKGAIEYDANWQKIGATNAKIVKINTSTLEVQNAYTFSRPIKNYSSNLIRYANNKLYLLDDDGVYSFENDFAAPQKIIETTGYGISITNNEFLWICDANSTAPQVIKYNLNGNEIAKYPAAPFPSAVIMSK